MWKVPEELFYDLSDFNKKKINMSNSRMDFVFLKLIY